MRVLVTGARGFIGKEVVKNLEKRGFDVLATDITTYGKLYLDVRQSYLVYSVLNKSQPDIVIHLAALVAGKPSLKEPYKYYDTNISGTLNVLEAMRLNKVKRLIYVSSWSVYGKPKSLPITEETPFCPENPYAVSKMCAEELVKSYSKLYGIKSIILRPTMVYGPNQKEKNTIQQIVDCAISEETFEIYGTGEHTRECLYVTDIAEVIIKAIEFLEGLTSSYDVFVIGTEKPHAIKDIVEIGQSIKSFPVIFKDVPTWAFSQACDMTKVKRFLNWKPKIDLREGIKRILKEKKK